MPHIYIDGDACPVKSETVNIANRHKLHVSIVSNGGLRPVDNPRVHMVMVDATPDAADDWIAEHIQAGDIAITADILLADRCIKLGAYVINPNGNLFTKDNIGSAVAGRALSAHLRELGDTTSHNPSFSKQDRSRFLQSLEQTIQKTK